MRFGGMALLEAYALVEGHPLVDERLPAIQL